MSACKKSCCWSPFGGENGRGQTVCARQRRCACHVKPGALAESIRDAEARRQTIIDTHHDADIITLDFSTTDN